MGKIDALNREFPVTVVNTVQSFGLHNFAVFFQKLVSDKVGGFFFDLKLVKFFLCQMVQPD